MLFIVPFAFLGDLVDYFCCVWLTNCTYIHIVVIAFKLLTNEA